MVLPGLDRLLGDLVAHLVHVGGFPVQRELLLALDHPEFIDEVGGVDELDARAAPS